MKLEFLGMQLNIWGLYCTIGALCAVAAMSVVCISRKMKPLSAPVLGLASLLMGMICSRVVYCLFTTLTEVRMPISAWIRVTDGGTVSAFSLSQPKNAASPIELTPCSMTTDP